MNEQMEYPQDVKKEYYSLIRRIQSVAKSQGYSIVTINVLMDQDGTPIAWTEPSQVKVEPKNGVSLLLRLGATSNNQL
jgi:hypothetical protein